MRFSGAGALKLSVSLVGFPQILTVPHPSYPQNIETEVSADINKLAKTRINFNIVDPKIYVFLKQNMIIILQQQQYC